MSGRLRLGTRRSLLAVAQSTWVAREIERLNPGTTVELVGIETRGDRIQDVSLRQVEGKEFFVAELDTALSAGQVDLNVHSLKDLSLERPAQFVNAAVPRRENPRDVILFAPDIEARLAAGEPITIGTSSPRRLENIPPFLEKALPRFASQKSRIAFVEIRGNVNTRLSRVLRAVGDRQRLDGVVLAFAGLIRLWRGRQPGPGGEKPEIERLLGGDAAQSAPRWMILPLRENPTAPGQGALAVECRADDARAREMIARLHHEPSAAQVARERGTLAEWGGGCHQRFGATAAETAELGPVFYVRGVAPDGKFHEKTEFRAPPHVDAPAGVVAAWVSGGSPDHSTTPLSAELPESPAWMIAHSRALPTSADWQKAAQGRRIWTSGVSSWFRLAERGIWVEGCAEGLGFAELASTLAEPVLSLPAFPSWAALTHEAAREDWREFGEGRATYRVNLGEPPSGLVEATHLFWSSGSQFNAWSSKAPAQARHACGPGKTAGVLRAAGLKPDLFPSVEAWKEWLRK